ncbi:uncharacterized protein G2W53_044565 [Senna tora]|uniref:Uncharacterized protein n=1 Tax=Senna tora TaxID=362788 RepID=A0A834SEI3_9FABA|nr:uncharacterized protein G2W53_044565 [Senna tora]
MGMRRPEGNGRGNEEKIRCRDRNVVAHSIRK